jgi:hypothetical protein
MKQILVRTKETSFPIVYLDELENQEKHFFGMIGNNGKDKFILSNFEGDYFWIGASNLLNRNKYTYSCIVSACNPGTSGAKTFIFESAEELIKWASK